MSVKEQVITILLCAAATMLTRILPFLIFNGKRPVPKTVMYLGNALPASIFAMLVVYCLRNVEITVPPYGLPTLIASAATVLTHVWKKNTLLSMLVGTVCYMLLIQYVF